MRRIAVAVGALACCAVAAAYWPGLEALELGIFTAVLVALSVVDIESRRIPNLYIGAAVLIRAAYLVASWAVGATGVDSLVASSVLGALVLGGGLFAATVVANSITGRDNLGGGDIKLFAVAGFYFGIANGLIIVMIACLIGVAWGLAGHVFARVRFGGDAVAGTGAHAHPTDGGMKGTFAFGPAIALACFLVMLAKSPLIGLM